MVPDTCGGKQTENLVSFGSVIFWTPDWCQTAKAVTKDLAKLGGAGIRSAH